ncbi:UNKNOWN [Stylonychia lemnae]|uniref:Uncharacterized protein n=1 Tax=Stylonychia lemnae TaxID=5949 RepID=A0A078AMX9_STYLE|nr:UNKNOWN [Stylonychia lemnae]|eukprot:CDW83514.1 UNKNOWN [Stylonychia lemnae]
MIRAKRKNQSQGENQNECLKIYDHDESNNAKESNSKINGNLEELDKIESKGLVHDNNYNNCIKLQAKQHINNSNKQIIYHNNALFQQPSYKQIFSIVKGKRFGIKDAYLNQELKQKLDLQSEIHKNLDISIEVQEKMANKLEISKDNSTKLKEQDHLLNQQAITGAARSLFQKVLFENSRI